METPTDTVASPDKLLALVEQLEIVFAGASLSIVAQDSADLDLRVCYHLIFLLDESDPFTPVSVKNLDFWHFKPRPPPRSTKARPTDDTPPPPDGLLRLAVPSFG